MGSAVASSRQLRSSSSSTWPYQPPALRRDAAPEGRGPPWRDADRGPVRGDVAQLQHAEERRPLVKGRSTRSSSRPRYQPRREPGFLQGTDSIDGGADGASAGCARERVAGFSGWDIGTAARRGPPVSRPRRAVRLQGARRDARPAGRGPSARAAGRAVNVLTAGPGTPEDGGRERGSSQGLPVADHDLGPSVPPGACRQESGCPAWPGTDPRRRLSGLVSGRGSGLRAGSTGRSTEGRTRARPAARGRRRSWPPSGRPRPAPWPASRWTAPRPSA